MTLALRSLLFSCPHCGAPSGPLSFPLCEHCDHSLLPAPPLCARCTRAAHLEPSECLIPESLTPHVPYDSLTALYLLTSVTYPILRTWKKKRGPEFDQRILKSGIETELPQADVIIPIPQSWKRAWQLGGPLPERIAQSLSHWTALPLLPALKLPGPRENVAALDALARKAKRLKIQVREDRVADLAGRDVLLVDDFLTTGKTIRTASLALKLAGARRVHAFLLGVRPFRVEPQSPGSIGNSRSSPRP